jgi:hypothetical protein
MSDKKNDFLKLVWNSSAKRQQRQDVSYIQTEFFYNHDKNSIIFIHIDKIDWKSFERALFSIHPSFIVDMRANPRFDNHGFTRKDVFSEIEKIGAKYVDIDELLGLGTKDKDKYIDIIEHKFLDALKIGPFAFLFGNNDLDSTYEDNLVKRVKKSKNKWKLSVVP